MKIFTTLSLTAALVVSGSAVATLQATAASGEAHAHMGHVSTAWSDTPDGMGFLPTAMAEAKIAAQHAALAMKKPGDLGWMKSHVRHVFNALAPAMEAKGPGLGYGVIQAANNSAKHINVAAKSDDATDNIRTHALHVATSAENTAARGDEIIVHIKKVLKAGTAGDAAGHVKLIVALADQLLAGVDANGDGDITWEKGEGGLNAAAKHMGIMVKGEGIN